MRDKLSMNIYKYVIQIIKTILIYGKKYYFIILIINY